MHTEEKMEEVVEVEVEKRIQYSKSILVMDRKKDY